MLGTLRGDPGPGGENHLLHGRVGPELCHHGRQALRQDGPLHGGGHQVQVAASQHAAGRSSVYFFGFTNPEKKISTCELMTLPHLSVTRLFKKKK